MNENAERLAAELYDASGVGWPGELVFYQELASAAGQPVRVLELGCGTGRVALALARAGCTVTGMDASLEMLAVARRNGRDLQNARWIEGDMRSFELGEQFELILIPGHSFQFMLTPAAQLDCLAAIRRHLVPGGLVAIHLDHQDLGWLAGLPRDPIGEFKRGKTVVHPVTGGTFCQRHAWSYAPATQTATVIVAWEELDADGSVLGRWEREPLRLHCVFRTEMEHLLARAELVVEALYGDFTRQPLCDDSTEMIWVVRTPE